MEGYKTLKEYFADYALYIMANHPGCYSVDGCSARLMMEKRIKRRFDDATAKFRRDMDKKRLTEYDLELIAKHEAIAKDAPLSFFLESMMGYRISVWKMKKIIQSQAFRGGMLPNLKNNLPMEVGGKDALMKYLFFNKDTRFPALHVVVVAALGGKGKRLIDEITGEELRVLR